MEKKFTLGMLSEMIGKYLQMESDNAIVNGYIKGVEKNAHGDYGVTVACATHYFSEKEMITLYHERKVRGNVYLFDNEQDCINNIAAMREVVSAETEHTTDIDVWKQRWWEVFFEFVKMGTSSEYSINATSIIIKDAMKEMDNFFKDK